MPAAKPGLLDPNWKRKLAGIGGGAEDFARSHPGTAESLIPVWGSGREAVADLYEGDYLGAAGNAVLAASDLFPAKAVGGVAAKAAIKGMTKVDASLKAGRRLETALRDGAKAAERAVIPSNPKSWKQTSQWYREQGYREKDTHAHHVFIEQGSALGKKYPHLVNQAWNLKPLDKVTHKRIHFNAGKENLPRFNLAERTWHGSPAWAKGASVAAPARAGVLTYEAQDHRKRSR